MKVEPEQRAALLGEYIAKNSATVRAAARAFGCSTSTVHKDVSSRLRRVDPGLFQRVQAVLARNKAERHLRGGAATRRNRAGSTFRSRAETSLCTVDLLHPKARAAARTVALCSAMYSPSSAARCSGSTFMSRPLLRKTPW